MKMSKIKDLKKILIKKKTILIQVPFQADFKTKINQARDSHQSTAV